MPNAGISHSWSKRETRLNSSPFKGLQQDWSEVPVNGHSASGCLALCVCNLTRGYKLRNCVHFKKRKLHNSATYGLSAARMSTRLSSEYECE